MEHLVPRKNARASATAKGFNQNAVAVVIVEYQDIVVAAGSGDYKFASLIRVDLACGRFAHRRIAMMCAFVGRIAVWESITVCSGGRRSGFDGPGLG